MSQKLNLDLKLLYELAKLHCTNAEMAVLMECSEETLTHSLECRNIIKKGKEDGRRRLRRLQFQKAEGQEAVLYRDKDGKVVLDEKGKPFIVQPGYAPDTTMQIWLGKQTLGQTDTQNIRINDEKPVEVIIKNYDKKLDAT